jgi:dephospho-CoA kinase
MNGKKIIGLTGSYCAGKNHVAILLEQRFFPVLDLDKLGHEVIETKRESLITRFGGDILGAGGLIDRKKLGQKVFGRPKELAALEEIIHPEVNRKTLEWIDAREEKVCFINAALLHRSSAFELLDAVILVEAPFFVRLLRARKRDRLPWISLIKRFWSQRKFRYQLFRKKTDIYNVGNPSGCANSGFFGLTRLFRRNKLEKRIDEILSLQGINKV